MPIPQELQEQILNGTLQEIREIEGFSREEIWEVLENDYSSFLEDVALPGGNINLLKYIIKEAVPNDFLEDFFNEVFHLVYEKKGSSSCLDIFYALADRITISPDYSEDSKNKIEKLFDQVAFIEDNEKKEEESYQVAKDSIMNFFEESKTEKKANSLPGSTINRRAGDDKKNNTAELASGIKESFDKSR